MQTLPIGRYRFFQRLQPTSVLNRIIIKKTSGCLQVFSASASWLIYLQEGEVIYACYADNMWDVLLNKLQQISSQVSTLNPGVYKQLKTIFESSLAQKGVVNTDYLAICWLVNQKYLTQQQAAYLIEELAVEVLNDLLKIQEGSYEITANGMLENMPKFCRLDLRMLMENCQRRVRNPYYAAVATPPQHDEQKTKAYSQSQNNQSGNSANHNDQDVPKRMYKILCIDDSPTVLNAIQRFLDEQVFEVVTISEPIKALMQIIRLKPDLILLDVGMPHLDGYELCGLVRKHTYFKNTPIIMVTARTGLIDRARAKMLGASGYLTKPFTQADLLKVLFHHLS